MSASVPLTVTCCGVVPQRTRATGVSGGRPWRVSSATMRGRFLTPMKKTSVPMPRGERRPVDAGRLLGRVLMAGDKGDGRGELAVAQGDAGIGRSGDGRRDARHDLERDAGLRQDFGLLPAAAEDEGVTALEARDDLVFPGLGDDQGVDLVLGKGVVAAFFADVDQLRVPGGVLQQGRGRQIVVNDHVGRRNALPAFDGDQAGVPGARSDQVDDGWFHFRVPRW